MMKTWRFSAFMLALTVAAPAAPQTTGMQVCMQWHRDAAGERPGQARYRVTYILPPASPGDAGHLVMGALDTSHVVWVQRTQTPLTWGSNSVSFSVADDSAYDLDFSIYRLNDQAFEAYRRDCRAGDCYFTEGQPGVERLVGPVSRVQPQPGAAPDC